MSKVVLVAGMAHHVPCLEGYDYIGVDHGAICCVEQNIPMIAAIGDFDSITKVELEDLYKRTKVRKLPSHKNETDSEEAIAYALSLFYDEIILYGGLGGRLDHELANLHLLIHRDLPISLMDENNTVCVIKPGTYNIKKQHKYLSFLALEKSCLSEEGVAYPLCEQVFTPSDIYSISNEIIEESAQITLHYGRMLMMQSSDA
ncbi:MAG: thiamine diphosphokinase [Longicatena sp.]